MDARAHARYVRISPRKVGQLLALIRGKSVAQAQSILALVTKGARPLVEKVLRSALANAGRAASADRWVVAQAWVGGGPTIKRMRAHAMGRGATIRHRTCHLTIVLKERPGAPSPKLPSKMTAKASVRK